MFVVTAGYRLQYHGIVWSTIPGSANREGQYRNTLRYEYLDWAHKRSPPSRRCCSHAHMCMGTFSEQFTLHLGDCG